MDVSALRMVLLLVSTLAGAALGGPAAGASEDAHPDVCLEMVTAGMPEGAWERVVEAISLVVSERTALFPAPSLEASPGPDGRDLPSSGTARVEIGSGHPGASTVATTSGCLLPGREWTARFGRTFLEASADQMLADAPTTPGIDSEVILEWHPDATRVRTLLAFAGPLDIPNGRCWVDDVLAIDASAGIAVASGEHGLETSPFAEGACGRFFDHLPDGGAGEQAVTLLPTQIRLEEGSVLRFVATDVMVEEDAILVGGTLELR